MTQETQEQRKQRFDASIEAQRQATKNNVYDHIPMNDNIQDMKRNLSILECEYAESEKKKIAYKELQEAITWADEYIKRCTTPQDSWRDAQEQFIEDAKKRCKKLKTFWQSLKEIFINNQETKQ